MYSRRFATATARTASLGSHKHDDEKACRPLRPKTSESTDCRKKKREEFDSHV